MTDLEIFGQYLYDNIINNIQYSIYEYDNKTFAVANGDFNNAFEI